MNIVETVRVRFEKVGNAKYISHLDLMRTMTRVLRRAQIPLWYTEGFSKHPYITFAAPLSLGYEGLCEYMDFRLEKEMSMEEIVTRLNTNMPRGIQVISASPAVHKVAAITASRWTLVFPADYEQRIRTTLAQDMIKVQKRTKKGTYKTVDLKPLITDAVINEGGDGGCLLCVTLPLGERSINPSLLIGAILGDETADVKVTREAVLMTDGNIFV